MVTKSGAEYSPVQQVALHKEKYFHISPNPATNKLVVSTRLPCAETRIYVLPGKTMIRQSLTGLLSGIDISTLKAGFYSIVVKEQEWPSERKAAFIKIN